MIYKPRLEELSRYKELIFNLPIKNKFINESSLQKLVDVNRYLYFIWGYTEDKDYKRVTFNEVVSCFYQRKDKSDDKNFVIGVKDIHKYERWILKYKKDKSVRFIDRKKKLILTFSSYESENFVKQIIKCIIIPSYRKSFKSVQINYE